MCQTNVDLHDISANDVNTLSAFLAHQQIKELKDEAATPPDAIVLCGSAILHCMEHVFDALQRHPSLAKVLVLSGGKGHSTHYLAESAGRNPKHAHLTGLVNEQGEASFMHKAFEMAQNDCSEKFLGAVLVDTVSTNCGSNAIESKKLLDEYGFTGLKNVVIVQDPTMSRRSLACFEKVYEGLPAEQRPSFRTCPTFVPKFKHDAQGLLQYDIDRIEISGLWETARFLDLIMGEIPRMRDDENGYGPKGKGFITHVDIPSDVEAAWLRLARTLNTDRIDISK